MKNRAAISALRCVLALTLWVVAFTAAHAGSVDVISNGTFAGSVNNWTNWVFSATGGRTGFTSFAVNNGPNSQEDNAGTLDLTQSGLSGLNSGPGALGAGKLTLNIGWNTCGTNPASLNVYVGGTLYATFTTPSNAATGSTAATTSYSGGATGTAGSTIPATAYQNWTYYPWIINLPTSVTTNGNLRLSFAQPTAGCDADISLKSASLLVNRPTVTLTKISNGSVGGFTFTGNNGWTSQTITTTTSGTGVTGATQTLAAASTSTTITEAIPAGYALASATCTGLGSGGTATPDLSTGALSLDAAATAGASAIACTFTNTKLPTLAVTKISNGGVGPFSFSGTNGFPNQTITTTTSGTSVSGGARVLSAASTATRVTEAIPAGYVLSSIACTGTGSGNTTNNLAGGYVDIATGGNPPGAVINCTFTNTKPPSITLTKISNGGTAGFTFTIAPALGTTPQTITPTAAGSPGTTGTTQILSATGQDITITEAAVPGYVLSAATCAGLGSGTQTNDLPNRSVAISAAAFINGATVACTFTNNKTPTVKVQKKTNGKAGGPFSFSQSGLASTPAAITTSTLAAEPTTPTAINATIGTPVTLTEGVATGFASAGATCTDANSAVTGNSTPVTSASNAITILAGNIKAGVDYTCLFSNNSVPTVKVQKTTLGSASSPTTFSFSTTGLTGSISPIATTAAGVATPASPTALSGTVGTPANITESVTSGYAIANWTCSDANAATTGNSTALTGSSATAAIPATNMVAGADYTCNFTNTKLPTITLTKVSNGATGAFSFTGTNGFANQTITTTASGTGVTGPTQALSAASTATTVTESIPSGYAVASITCTGLGSGGTATPNLAAGSVAVDGAATAAGSNLACTFNNTKLPTIAITKISNGGVGTFSFTGTNGFVNQGITTSTSGTGVTGTTQVLGAAATATRVTETIPSGYTLSNITCSGAGAGNTTMNTAGGYVDITAAGVPAGAAINCSFTNDKLPSLTLVKTVSNTHGGTVAANSVNLTATGPTTISGVTGASTVTNGLVPLGTYALSEANPSGYAAGPWSCNAGTLSGSNLTLAAGQNATCTINDADISPLLTLVKTVTNDNGGTAAVADFTLIATNGATTISGSSGSASVTNAAVNAGTWTLSEGGPTGYAASVWNCTSGSLSGSSLTLSPGQNATCTINNNDISPKLTLVKQVINAHGGTLAAGSVTLTANGPTPITGTTGAASVTNATVNAGSYTLSESATPGYTPSPWSCTAGTLTGSSLALAPGQNATCTITNSDNAPILTLVKTVTNDNGGTVAANSVNLSASGPVAISGVTGSAAVTSAPVSSGTYTLSEANPAGYAAGPWSCTAGTLSGNSLTLALGQTSTCTINDNDVSPALTLTKTVTNTHGGTVTASSVILTATGPTTITGASGTAAVTNAAVNPGTYALSEANPAGYTPGTWSCTGGSLSGSSLSLALGQTANCTINNADIAPTLTLVKTVTNNSGGTLSASSVTLKATGPTTITGVTGDPSITTAAVNAGTYALSEVNPPGYVASAWSCSGGSLSGSNVSLAPGQNATCTINNTDIAPKLTLVKTVGNTNGGTAAATAFTLSATGPVSISGATGTAAVTNAAVKVGTYGLGEAGPVGYAASTWSCTAGTLSGSNLTLAAGDVATCTITNSDIAPKLTLVKTVTNDNGGTVAASSVTLSATGPVSITGTSGAVAVTARSVKAGTYALSEVNPSGYAAGNWSCDVGTLSGSNLTLVNGQVATCTINDDDIPPVLTLSKTVTNDNGGAAAVADFTLAAAGPTAISGTSGAPSVTGALVNAGVYTLSETGAAGYAAGAWNCTAGSLSGNSLTLTPGQNALCTINNNDSPATLTLIKTVNNTHGGTAATADFTLKATGPTTISGTTTAAAITNATVNAGTYTLSESGPGGYAASAWSCTSGTLTGNSLVLANGQNATCSIANADIGPQLTLTKTVTNTHGGTAQVSDFALTATGPATITGVTGAAAITNAPVNVGTYTLTEAGPAGYSPGAWSCTAGTLTGNSLVLSLNQSASCSLNNADISARLTLKKTVINDNGGTAAVGDFFLSATGPTNISGVTGGSAVTNAFVGAGTYTLSESGPAGYTAGAWSCTAGSLSGSTLTLALNQNAVCTISNDDNPVTLTLNKISNGGTGSFTFNGTNGFGSQTITTSSSGNSAAGPPHILTATSTPTTITETIPTGYGLTAASCTGIGTGSATANLLTGTLNLDAAATAPGNAVNCTFTNSVAKFSISKVADQASVSVPGPITYTISVANTGLADLTAPNLSDALVQGASPKTLTSGPTLTSGDTANPGVLNIGETWTYKATYDVTQADIDNGATFSNAATFAAQQASPQTSAPAATTIVKTPKLSVTKTSPTASFNATNTVIPYSYVVRNAGNVTITQPITVSDNKTTVMCPALTGGILAPNDTITCTSSYTTIQADIDAGGVTNTASATSGAITSPTAQAFVPAIKLPAMTANKTPTAVNFINPGDTVSYKYTVTNTGNTTLAAPFTINDNLIPTASITCPATNLAPGQFLDCTGTYFITQDDLDLGRVTNLATANSGATTSPQVSQTVPIGVNPALTLTKALTPSGFTAVGSLITYNYVVTNTGSATLTRVITVIDDKIGTITCRTPPPNFVPGNTQNCSATYTITQADLDRGYVTNQATANTTFGGGNVAVVSPPANATATATQNPILLVTKSVTPAAITGLGQLLTYAIDVKNTGNVTITNTQVSDPLIPSLSCNIATLAPGANDNSCAGTYTITQADVNAGSINNTATATGVAPQGAAVTASGSKSITIPQVKTMSLAKALTSNADQDASSSITLGDTLTYTVTATNTGTVTQTNVAVNDSRITPASKSCTSLAPNATCILTGSYSVTQADVDAGTISNTASLTSDIITSAQNTTVNTPVAQSSVLTLVKVKTGYTDADSTGSLTVGDTVAYTITATNSGTVNQANVVVSDAKITPASQTCPTLAPSATCVLSGTHVVTSAEATAGQVSNTASVTSSLITTPVTTTVNTAVTRIIIANNDVPAPVNGATGNANVINTATNDSFNGAPLSNTTISGTVLVTATPINGGPVPSVSTATGIVSVPPGTPAGTYTIHYQICEKAVPGNCAEADIIVQVTAAPVVATNDSASGINGASGAAAVTNAFNGDTINGNPATSSTATLTAVTAVPPQLAFNTSTGAVDVLAGTPAGTYSFDYKICEKLNPTNCKTATVSVAVVAALLVANNDTPAAVNGANGDPSLVNAYANDTLNGAPVSAGTITGTIVTPATSIAGGPVPALDPATGFVSVPPATPAGTYTITYQICEQLNPTTNCKTATVTVGVAAAALIATDDTAIGINGRVGATAVLNAFSNDTLNGFAATPSNTTMTLATGQTVSPGITFAAATGQIDVVPATPAGTYSFKYQLCEKLNPANCKVATISVTVTAALIEAINDVPASINGASGGSTASVLANDRLNGAAVVPADINVTPGTAPAPTAGAITMNPDGTITVAAGTTAGSYDYSYKICEKLNPANCATATATVIVTAAALQANADVPASVNGATGTAALVNAYANDTLNGVTATSSTITGTVTTPAAPLTAGANVPVLDVATGIVSVPAGTPAATYAITYEICEKLNPANCSSATVTVDVTAAPIVATADAPAATNGATGSAALVNAYANDTLNGAAATPSKITGTVTTLATPVTAGANVPVLDVATGTVSVPAGTPASTYTIDYKICEKLNPANCSTAVITVDVTAAPIAAVADTPPSINGASGGSTATALANDTLNGAAVIPAEITLTPGTAPTPTSGSVVMNADGTITVASGTTAGSYTYPYKICENLNPSNCSSTTVTVVVAAAAIVATADAPASVNGATGNPAVIDAYANDTLNGAPVILSEITGAVLTAATPASAGAPVPALDPATGTVSVPAATPASTYTIKYKICENLNPANCSTTTISVVVSAAPVVASNDTATGINGANGASAVLNAFNGDTVNGQPATTGNSVLSVAPLFTVPAQLVFDATTGQVDVKPATPAGTYSFNYQICEKLNPTNCKTASITVDVIAAAIVASDDNPMPVNGATGNASLINAYANDQLGSVAATPSTIIGTITTPATPVTVGAPVPALDVATGTVSVPAGTPAASYTIVYKICEKLNPANCSSATVTIDVTAAPIVANNDFTPIINGLVGNPSVDNAYANDTLNGVAVVTSGIIGTVTTPATPASAGAPVPNLDGATGTISVPADTPAGTYTIDYKICEKLNPTNCATATITVPVTAAQIIANNDTPASVNGVAGSPSLINAFANDTLNGTAIDTAKINASIVSAATPRSAGEPVPLFDVATGNVSVPADTPAGTYTIQYKICEKLNPSSCATADITVVVDDSPVVATSDSVSGINGANGATNVLNALTGDTINGTAASSSNAVLSVATGYSVPPQLSFNTATGNVSLAAATPIGTYAFDYQICEKLNPANCKIATESVTVSAAVIQAVDDAPAAVNGATGNPSLVDAYANDALNGTPVTFANTTGSVITPATPASAGANIPALDVATGTVSVPPATPAGTYTIIYDICEKLNPTNCSSAKVTVLVDPATLVATDDTATGINGATGAAAVTNAFNGDTVNGATATASNAVLSIASTSTLPPELAFNFATGAVDVLPGTPAGTYSFDYQICEKLNPANCKTAKITVSTVASPVVATDDTATGINGASGATAVTNALNGDSINGAAATTSNAILSVAAASTVPPQLSFDASTGVVDVMPNTPAGIYTFNYQICEKLNPGNCKTAKISVTTVASAIVATSDTATGINGASGATAVTNAFNNDTVNGAAAAPANAILSIATTSSLPPELQFDTATGSVDVKSGTPAGIYAFDYQICEKLNPANCKTATISVTTMASPVVATPDTVSNVNGTSGASAVVNALSGDLINGVAATTGNAILSVATGSTVPPQLVFTPATGAVDVKPSTPAGTYGFDYQICEKLNPANCKTATITVNVVGGPVVATDDVASGINGASGATAVVNVYAGDTINGVAASTSNSTVSLATGSTVPPELVFTSATGAVDVKPGTPANTYAFKYQICENLNPANCAIANVSVTVGTAVLTANPDAPAAVNGATGSTNIVNAYANDTLNSVAATPSTITGTVTTPATPVSAGALVPSLDVATGIVSVPAGTPAATYTITYKICEQLNPSNCSSAVITIVISAAPVVATSDTVSGLNGENGATAVLNAFAGDTINGQPATTANATVILAAGSTVPPELVFTPANGNVDLKPGTKIGSYTFDYTLCEILNPANCKTATETVNVIAAPLVATGDTPAAINGATGNPSVVNAFTNDSFNGAVLDLAKVTATVTVPATSVGGGPIPALDVATGIVSVPAGTPAGTYQITYQLCENLNPVANCKTATITVMVDAAPIAAVADAPAAVNGSNGNPALVDAYANDILNGNPLDTPAKVATITGTITTPATPVATGAPVPAMDPSTGTVSVPAATPAGTYTITYKICEKLNPANCSSTTVTVIADAAPVAANADAPAAVNGATGTATLVNVYVNDTLNGIALDTPAKVSAITGSVTTPATSVGGGPVPALDVATGNVAVPPGTPAGTYTIAYKICEILNPTNCASSTLTVNVAAAAIAANPDTGTSVVGATGSANVVNAYANDTLNGTTLDTPAKVSTITGTVTTPATPSVAGANVPVLDVTTGIVSVPAATPAGSYTITYKICEKLNAGNCASSTVTIPVTAAVIVANPDTATNIDGYTGNSNVLNAYANDQLNGAAPAAGSLIGTVVTPANAIGSGPVPVLDPVTGIVSVPAGTPTGTYTIAYQICEKLNPSNCASSSIMVNTLATAVSGTVFKDTNGNGVKDAGEPPLQGYIVQLLHNGTLVAATTSDVNGNYLISGFPPTSGYELLFIDPATTVATGVISGLDFSTTAVLINENHPIDPSGTIYDSVTGAPIAGAVVKITDAGGIPLPALCLLPNQQGQTTTASGQYRFDLLPGAAPQCPAGLATYRIQVTGPPNYVPGISTKIPPQGTALNADACATAPASCLVSPSATVPPVATPAPYYLSILLKSGSPNVINNHIPLDPILTGKAVFTKTALKSQVHRGERVAYVIQATAMNFTKANVVDVFPPGFDYVPGSALVNGVATTPTISGNQLTFSAVAATGGAVKIELTLVANAAAQPGPAINKAQLQNFFSGAVVANAQARVLVAVDPVFDCGDIIGRVFDDKNRNGYQDDGEEGLPGVRVATVNGVLVTTDKFGRFHVACADLPDQQIGSNFIMKLDARTLPTGYSLTTENPRDVRLTAGKMTKLNFGAARAHLVDLDLNGKVFAAGSTELLPQWRSGVATLLTKLMQEPSTLRLTYHMGAEPHILAAQRLAAVAALITSHWNAMPGHYPLSVETRSVDGAAP